MRRGFVLSVAALLLVGLSGCAADAPVETLEPTPWPPQTTAAAEPEPTRMTDEEALGVGVSTYQAYLDAAARTYDQGFDDGTLVSLVTSNWMADAEGIIQSARSEDWTVEGAMTLENAHLVALDAASGNSHVIAIEVCLETASMNLLHQDGTPSRTPDAPTRSARVVTLNNGEGSFKIDSVVPADGETTCG